MKLLAFNKPYGVPTQFRAHGEDRTLKDFISLARVYPAGRLDKDSEGLVLLTDCGALQHRITDPRHKMPKTYWVQVEGEPNPAAIQQLQQGILLKEGMTQPAQVKHIDPPRLWERVPPIRVRQSIPTHWLEVTLHEGRNRQVRRMTAAVGLPTLRLVRHRIGPWTLADIPPGDWCELPIPDVIQTTLSHAVMAKSRPQPNRQRRGKPSS
ncbi:MAG: pseudouridine synthase [Gammaproteobacteria bacterium]|nr:pseudouridine synthase [Gammaproteobacteria bacterium]